MDEQICTAIVPMLARIGIKIDLNAQTKTKFFTKILGPNYDTDFYMLGWTPSTYDAHNVLFTILGTRDGKRGEVNSAGYSNPELDTLTEKIGVEANQTRRNDMIRQTIKIMQNDVGYIPLHQQVIVWATRKNVQVVQPADNFFPYRFIEVK
jgi:peptide/nickel transport system substrate-binding protein